MTDSTRVAIVGSGFAGSILARCLHRQGHRVTLLERSHHPRFALGESSTPLAGIALERLAERWDLPDLKDLARRDRWLRNLPELRRGLKRGFTFLAPSSRTPSNRTCSNPTCSNPASSIDRLLVAASPADPCADAHWMRSDVDHHLVEAARKEGVRVLEGIVLDPPTVPPAGEAWHWQGQQRSKRLDGHADLLIDASGPAGWLARVVAPNRELGGQLSTLLLAAHFDGIPPLEGKAHARAAPENPKDPYPAGQAAVHHLLDEGWLYELRFDDGRTSAGLILDRHRLAVDSPWLDPSIGSTPDAVPDELWAVTLGRYPNLWERLAAGVRCTPWTFTTRLQRQAERAAGANWALLPSTFAFFSPLFSTGMAWSLIGVERLADLCDPRTPSSIDAGLQRYAVGLANEADHLRRLTESAYSTLPDLDRLHAVARIYFAAASFEEIRQRLVEEAPTTATSEIFWSPFLRAGDPRIAGALSWIASQTETSNALPSQSWAGEVAAHLTALDVVGLDAPDQPGLYPARLATILERRDRLGLGHLDADRTARRLRC